MSWEFSGSSVDLLRRGLTLEVSHLTNWLGTSQGLIPLYSMLIFFYFTCQTIPGIPIQYAAAPLL